MGVYKAKKTSMLQMLALAPTYLTRGEAGIVLKTQDWELLLQLYKDGMTTDWIFRIGKVIECQISIRYRTLILQGLHVCKRKSN